MTDDLTKLIAEIRQLCDKAQAIIKAGNAPLVQLAEVEPELKPDGYDDPDSEYWERLSDQAEEKVKQHSFKAYLEVVHDIREKNPGITWTWRQRAEAMQAKVAELDTEHGR